MVFVLQVCVCVSFYMGWWPPLTMISLRVQYVLFDISDANDANDNLE